MTDKLEKSSDNEMTFFEHVAALRPHLLRGGLALFVIMIAAFLSKRFIIDVLLMGPQSPDFPTNRILCHISHRLLGDATLCINSIKLNMINTALGGQFNLHMQVSMVTGVVLAVPYLLWELWRFVAPALTDYERYKSRMFVFYVSLCFFTGLLFGYFLIVPLSINFLAGYQAMDILSVAGFAIIIQDSMVQSGLKTWKEQRPQVAGSTGVAALLLAVVYGGLTFLGATTSTAFGDGLDQAALIVAITKELLGQAGVVILAIVVTLACLTTAIGLFGATASYFEEMTKGRLSYRAGIFLLAVIGCAICNLGLSTIINIANPVLSVICPPFMTTVVLLAFQNWISRAGLYKGAALGATLTALVLTFHDYLDLFPLVELLPFYDYGFGWLIPAAVGGVIGALLSKPVGKDAP